MRMTTGAHYGLRDWMIQRITAVVMAVYTLIILGAILAGVLENATTWHSFFHQGWVRYSTFLFSLCLCYHAWIGIRDIWMDYIKPVWVRVTLHVITLLSLLGCAGWMMDILWGL